MGSWAWSAAGQQRVAVGLAAVAAVLLLAVVAAPAARRGIARAWMAVGTVIRRILTFVLLTVLYVAVLPVFALIRFRDPLRLRRSAASTFWDDHETDEPTLDRASRPF